MKVLEVLLNNRWILKSRDRELYYQVKEALASGEEKKFLREKLGYQVLINPYMSKVEKLPAAAETWMGISAWFLCFLRIKRQRISLCCQSLRNMYRASTGKSRLTGLFTVTAVI